MQENHHNKTTQSITGTSSLDQQRIDEIVRRLREVFFDSLSKKDNAVVQLLQLHEQLEAKDGNNNRYSHACTTINEFICDDRQFSLLVTGSSMSTTALSQGIAHQLWNKNYGSWLPIRIPIYSGRIDHIIDNQLLEHGLGLIYSRLLGKEILLLKKACQQGLCRLLVIIEEWDDHYEFPKLQENVFENNGWWEGTGWPDLKVISMCRTEALINKDAHTLFHDHTGKFQRLDLKPLSMDQVTNYLRQFIHYRNPPSISNDMEEKRFSRISSSLTSSTSTSLSSRGNIKSVLDTRLAGDLELKIDDRTNSVIAMLHEARKDGNPGQVFLMLEDRGYGSGRSFIHRYDLCIDGEDPTKFSIQKQAKRMISVQCIEEVLNGEQVQGRSWQINDSASEKLGEDISYINKNWDNPIAIYTQLGEKIAFSLFQEDNGFTWACAMLERLRINGGLDIGEQGLPNKVEDLNFPIPSRFKYFNGEDMPGTHFHCYPDCYVEYKQNIVAMKRYTFFNESFYSEKVELALGYLEQIGCDKILEDTCRILEKKHAPFVFSIGVNEKMKLIKTTLENNANNILSVEGIQALVKVLNKQRKNSFTHFFWHRFREGEITASCEYFLTRLIVDKKRAVLRQDKYGKLYLRFSSTHLCDNIPLNISIENIGSTLKNRVEPLHHEPKHDVCMRL